MKFKAPISSNLFLITFIVILNFPLLLKAQDPQFSQFYANSLFLNPGFTGNTTQLRMMTSYRNQWTALPQSFVSYTAAVDYNFSEANSGLGLNFARDKSGTSGLSFSSVGLSYSYYIQLKRNVVIRPGLRVSYGQFSANQDDFVFADQIARDNTPTSVENIGQSVNYFDFSTGAVLAHKEKYWFGFAFDHLNRPSYSLIQTESELPIKFSFHGGWNFELNNNSRYQKATNLRLIANYKAQELWDQLDFGVYIEQDPLVFGMWYRGLPGLKKSEFNLPNHDAIVLLLGVKTKDMQIGYSYDATISRLSGNSGGSHEISITYEIASQRKKRRKKRFFVPCAKF